MQQQRMRLWQYPVVAPEPLTNALRQYKLLVIKPLQLFLKEARHGIRVGGLETECA